MHVVYSICIVISVAKLPTTPMSDSYGRPQKSFQRGNVDIWLMFFRLLTMQCKLTFTKRLNLST